MSYTRVNWQNAPSTATPVNAENLNTMDKGIADAHSQLAQIPNQYVAKETGKGLSTNDYTNTDKAEVAKVVNKADKTYVDTITASIASGSPAKTFTTLALLQADADANTVEGKKKIYLVTADGNWYYWNGTAWTAGGTYQSSGIGDGTVTLSKLSTDVLSDIKGKANRFRTNKNLIDKSKVTDGYYVSSATGNLTANSSYYVSDYIEIEPNTAYAKNTYDQCALYDANKVYISGIANNVEFFTSPVNAKYIRMTIAKSYVSPYYEIIHKAQLEKGATKTPYETGLSLLKREQLIDFPSWLNGGNFVIVAKSGGDFTTIQSAVDNIRDSSATKRYTILIMPGTYQEAVSIQTKYIDLIGINLGSVTLINKSGSYDTPPLEMSSLNNIKNLIIISSEDEKPVDYSGEPAYCIHHDYVGEGENYIENCKLISYSNAPIGIGTHQNQKITIKNSELKMLGSTSRPALLFHPKVTTATGQKLTLDNCRMWSQGYSVLSIIDSNNNGYAGGTGDNRDTEIACYNNMFWSEINGKTDIIYNPTGAMTTGAIDGYILLSPESYGNNAPELNAQ